MHPILRDGQIVFAHRIFWFTKINIGDIIVFEHSSHGRMIKLVELIKNNKIKVKGTLPQSVDSAIFGLINKEDILYKIFTY